MKRTMTTKWIGGISLAAVAWLCAAGAHASDLLDPQEAFGFSAAPGNGGKTIEARFRVADGYYLYRDRFGFTASNGTRLGTPEYPAGETKLDETFGRHVAVYRGDVIVKIPVQSGTGMFTLTTRFQVRRPGRLLSAGNPCRAANRQRRVRHGTGGVGRDLHLVAIAGSGR